jgi:hypothetical protein
MIEEAEAEEEEREKLERERNPFEHELSSNEEDKTSPSSKKQLLSSFSSSFSSPNSYGFPQKHPRYSLFPLQDSPPSTTISSSLPRDSTIPSSISFKNYSSVEDIVLSSPTDSPTPSLSNPSLLSLGTNLTRGIHSLLRQSSMSSPSEAEDRKKLLSLPSTSTAAFPLPTTSTTTTASSLTPFPSFEDSIKVLNQIKLLKVLLGKCIYYASVNNIEFFSSLTNKHQNEMLFSSMLLSGKSGSDSMEVKEEIREMEEAEGDDNDDIMIADNDKRMSFSNDLLNVENIIEKKQEVSSSSNLHTIKVDYDSKISQLKSQSYQLSECIQSLVNEIMKLNHQYELSLQHQYHAIYQHKLLL